MGFLGIFYARQNILRISLFFCNLVHEVLLKSFAIGEILAAVYSSIYINSRKFLRYPLSLSKIVFMKCLNDLLVFTQNWFGYPSFFCENYKQLCSRDRFRKLFLDFSSNENYSYKLQSVGLKSRRLLKTLLGDMSLLSHYANSTQNYFSYFFEVEEKPVIEDGFDEKELSDSKLSMENEKVMDSTGIQPNKQDMGPNFIAMDTESFSLENENSGNSAETAKRKPDEEYVHKLKRLKNGSKMSGCEDDASRKDRPQEQSASKDVIYLGFNHNSEICLTRDLEQPEIQNLLSVHRFGASVNTENESFVNLQQVQSECNRKLIEKLTGNFDFNKYLGNEKLLVISKEALYSLGRDQSEVQEKENRHQSDFNEKSGNGNEKNSGNDKFLLHKRDESYASAIDFKKLNLLPNNERWKNIAEEIKVLKKQIERKDRSDEFTGKKENFSSDVFSLISKKYEQRIGSSNESFKTSEVENQLNAVRELSCISNKDNEERYKVIEEKPKLIMNSSPEPKPGFLGLFSKKNEPSNTSSSINRKEKMLSKEQEHLDLLFASYFRNKRLEMDNSRGASGNLVDQEMLYITTPLDDSRIGSAADALGPECGSNMSSRMSKFQREFATKCDLNADLELPYVSSILDSPVSEKEYPMFRNEINQNLNIATSQKKTFPSSKGNNNQDFGNLNNAETDINANYSQSDLFKLPVPIFAESVRSQCISALKLQSEILSPDFAPNNQTGSSESNLRVDRETRHISQNHQLAARIGIDDFEVGEGSMPEKDLPLKRSSDYKPYPGLVSDLKKVKKDARYQKKFYRNPPSDKPSHMSETSSGVDLSSGAVKESLICDEITSTQKVLSGKDENITSG